MRAREETVVDPCVERGKGGRERRREGGRREREGMMGRVMGSDLFGC